jgi:hypothetical protein
MDVTSAVRIVTELAASLGGAAIPFNKVDSLLRGTYFAAERIS